MNPDPARKAQPPFRPSVSPEFEWGPARGPPPLCYLRRLLFGLLLVAILSGALLVRRVGGEAPPAWLGRRSARAIGLGAATVLVAAFPLVRVSPFSRGASRVFFGDATSHARVALDMARRGLPHGWLDTYLGGFPFAHQYPPLGWLLLAAPMRLGVEPALATLLLGLVATLAAPLTLYAVLVRAGGRPELAALGGLVLSWVNPYNPFVGGYDAFFTSGLVSQVVALPLVIALAGAVATGGNVASAVLAALSVAAHPELAACALAVTGTGALASGRASALKRFARAGLSAVATALALYGQGIVALDVPFGWPPGFGWRQLGFGTSRLGWWFLDGDLFDYRSDVPVLTALAGASLVVLALGYRSPPSRALVGASAAAVLLGASGPLLSASGALGHALLSVFQPLRALALLPPLAAAVVAVAAEEAAPLVGALLSRAGPKWLAPRAPLVVALLLGALSCFALPGRLRYLEDPAAMLDRSGSACADPPPGYDPERLRRWLGTLRGGRLWFDESEASPLGVCVERDGLTLASGVPIGTTTAVGSHLGILWLAAQRLEPARARSVDRAEALGVRYLLVGGRDTVPDGFMVREQNGAVALLSSRAPTDLVGAGCVTERWQAGEAELRARLAEALRTPEGADRLLDPARLVALEHGAGAIRATAVRAGNCDARSARITSRALEPGLLEATVVTSTPVDVVLRVTWFPTWRVEVERGSRRDAHAGVPGLSRAADPRRPTPRDGDGELAAGIRALPRARCSRCRRRRAVGRTELRAPGSGRSGSASEPAELNVRACDRAAEMLGRKIISLDGARESIATADAEPHPARHVGVQEELGLQNQKRFDAAVVPVVVVLSVVVASVGVAFVDERYGPAAEQHAERGVDREVSRVERVAQRKPAVGGPELTRLAVGPGGTARRAREDVATEPDAQAMLDEQGRLEVRDDAVAMQHVRVCGADAGIRTDRRFVLGDEQLWSVVCRPCHGRRLDTHGRRQRRTRAIFKARCGWLRDARGLGGHARCGLGLGRRLGARVAAWLVGR